MSIKIALLAANLFFFTNSLIAEAATCFPKSTPTKVELSKPLDRLLPKPGAKWIYSNGTDITTEIELTSGSSSGVVTYSYPKFNNTFQEDIATYSDINPLRKGKKILIRFPLKDGDKWEDSFSEKGKIQLVENTAATYDYEEQSKSYVVGIELIKTAAGTFKTFHILRFAQWKKTNPVAIEQSNSIRTEGGIVAGYTRTDIWFAPAIGRAILKAQRTAGSERYLETDDVLKMADAQIIELIAYSDEKHSCKTNSKPSLARPGDVLQATWPMRRNDTWEFYMQNRPHNPLTQDPQESHIASLRINEQQPVKTADEFNKWLEENTETYRFDPEGIIKTITTPSPSKKMIEKFFPQWLFSKELEDKNVKLIHDYYSALPTPTEHELAAYRQQLKTKLKYFKGGKFLMGDYTQAKGQLYITRSTNDNPAHQVTLSGFSISKNRITYAEYDLYTRIKKIPPINTEKYMFGVRFRYPNYPAGNITWQQAQDFCDWLGDLTGKPFSLPTEAQWEYAARGAGAEIYYASSPKVEKNMGELMKMLKTIGDNAPTPSDTDAVAVGTYPPNRAGIYDMVGYGTEWVKDWYAPYTSTAAINPTGPETGEQRVIRTSSTASDKTVISRLPSNPDKKEISLNFRCALNTHKPWR